MSNVIYLLERMGQDAQLKEGADLELAISEADLSSELRQALFAKDKAAVERELDICPDVHCVVFPAEDEEEESEQPEDDSPAQDNLVVNG